jgi:hypothetical protein
MDQQSTHNVNDLPASGRAAIEQLLGHPLSGDQAVFIMAFKPDETPDPAIRASARARLEQMFTDQARRADEQGINAATVDEAVDEAMRHVRPRFE